MTENLPDNPLGLPAEFYSTIAPYINLNAAAEKRQVADTPSKLLAIWKSALAARQSHPESQELIAEWAMSAGATSPLINDNDIFEDLHFRFGSLEVPASDGNEADWQKLNGYVHSFDNSLDTFRQTLD
jgi:hypothetical protein